MSSTSSDEVRFPLDAEVFDVVRRLTFELPNGDVESLSSRGWTPEVLTSIRDYLGSAEARFRTGYDAEEISTALAALTESVTRALPATRNRLDYRSSEFVNFRHYTFDADGHHAYRWVNSKRYSLREPGSRDEILRDLIATTEYRDGYIGGGVDPDGQIHGPYQLSAISPDSYREVGRDEAEAIVRRWLATAGTVPAELLNALEPVIFEPIRAAHSIHELKRLGAAAVCSYGEIHLEFHELVLVDDTSVRMIVAADD
ncbi:hypothetical protein AB0H71_26880 [Nocardia sp. NPDC050697]|uniref:hypothetical protein n=1 Tax=Nocardia sp. NPDC050697 TaxID=3155158 RepID=UPI0033C24E5E